MRHGISFDRMHRPNISSDCRYGNKFARQRFKGSEIFSIGSYIIQTKRYHTAYIVFSNELGIKLTTQNISFT